MSRNRFWYIAAWLALTLAVAGLPVVQRFVLLPLYAAGYAGWPLSMLNRINSMVVGPGKRIAYSVLVPTDHYFTNQHLAIAFAFNLILYGVLIALPIAALYGVYNRPELKPEEDSAGGEVAASTVTDPSKRRFLAAAGGAAGVALCSTYPVLVSPGRLTVRRLAFPVRGLPPSLSGLTIAQITDVHHDEWISLQHVRRVVELANSLRPDVVALTGDYISSNAAFIKGVAGALANLRPKLGTVACMGNHDWWGDERETRRQFARQGIPLIDNDRRFITADRRLLAEATGGLCLAAVGDLWEDTIDLEKALARVPPDMPRLVLAHNPDTAETGAVLDGGHRIDLMLSGHTHGGQVRIPGLGAPIIPSSFGEKYAQGLAEGPRCPVQISAGVGMAGLPVRFNVSPEIVLITLVRAEG